ncbi:MAG: right-handed parallel beta-helix repeat-containing protein [Acidobacteriia bacterium]|nr:right-handed parallel beta-helix repeat-containing protein [Terriglobia bacterium]
MKYLALPGLLIVLPLAGQTSPVPISVNNQVLAAVRYDSAHTPVYVEIFPNSTYKPDEGDASNAGTTAWAAKQLTHGGTIFVHAGNYTVGTSITISTAGTSLICANPAAAVFAAAPGLNSIMFKIGWAGAQRQGMVVRDCGFAGAMGSQTSGTILHVRDTSNALIENNFIRFAKQFGIVLEATIPGVAVQNHLVGNSIYECGSACLEILGVTTDNIVDRNTIGGSDFGDHASPWVYITAANGLQFTNNHVWGTDHNEGLEFDAVGKSGVLISHNVIETVGGSAIYFNANESQIVDNNFYGTGTWSQGAYAAIELDQCAGMLVSGNRVTGWYTTQDGVRMDHGASESLVANNVFRQLTGTAVSVIGRDATNNAIGMNVYTDVGSALLNSGTHTVLAATQAQ